MMVAFGSAKSALNQVVAFDVAQSSGVAGDRNSKIFQQAGRQIILVDGAYVRIAADRARYGSGRPDVVSF